MALLLENLTFTRAQGVLGYEHGGRGLYCHSDGGFHHGKTDIVPLTGVAIRAANNVHIPDYLAKIAQHLPLTVKLLRMRGWAYDQLHREAAAGQLVLLGKAEEFDEGSSEASSLLALADVYGEIAAILETAKDIDRSSQAFSSVFDNSEKGDNEGHLLKIKKVVEDRLGEGMVPFSKGDQVKDLSEAKSAAASSAAAVKATKETYHVPEDSVDEGDTRASAFARFKALDKGKAQAPKPATSAEKPAAKKPAPPTVMPKPIKPVPAIAPAVLDEQPDAASAAVGGGVSVPKSASNRRRRQFKEAPVAVPQVEDNDGDSSDELLVPAVDLAEPSDEEDAVSKPASPAPKSPSPVPAKSKTPSPAPRTPSPVPAPAAPSSETTYRSGGLLPDSDDEDDDN